jgi:predicted AAA+ superfamily ATPase
MLQDSSLLPLLDRIANALERMAPPLPHGSSLDSANAFIWHAQSRSFQAVFTTSALPLELLQGIERQKETLFENTLRFANGYPANNALLWGARGNGKSSLVKAVHAAVNREVDTPVALIELAREDIPSMPDLLTHLREHQRQFIILCDDLSFEPEETSYKSLKSVLDGGIASRPENVLLYATSNRRHLMPRAMMENESKHSIHPSEAEHEKISLSDRFGLWLGFHELDQKTYLDIVHKYAHYFGLSLANETLIAEALQWSTMRGGRTGRIAWQFTTDLAGRLQQPLKGNKHE